MTAAVHILGLNNINGSLQNAVITVGNFDGVHLGHRRIIRTMTELAKNQHPVVAMTFDPPPACLAALRCPQRLRPHEHNVQLLMEAGCTHVVTIPTTMEFLNMSPDEFIQTVMLDRINPTFVVEGPDFHFGKNRGGNVRTLLAASENLHFDVHIVEEMMLPDNPSQKLSSSLIRDWVQQGKLEKANQYLGSPFIYIGEVIPGEGKGRSFGFPTINLPLSEQIVPGDGVYAGRVKMNGIQYDAAIAIGGKLTFDGTTRLIEAYLLNTEGDFYGQTAELIPLRRIRDQKKFPSKDALIQQIHRDVQTCNAILKEME